MSKITPVSEKYFGFNINNSQECDEPYDPASKIDTKDGTRLNGRGSQGGGSKPTPQAAIMKKGSGKLMGSYPKQTQKIRG
jgi:hypothetical protein